MLLSYLRKNKIQFRNYCTKYTPNSHCGFCGTGFESESWPKLCTCCNNSTYRNPIPVAVGLLPIVNENNKLGLLLTRRNIRPHIGELCFPGDFVDWGESLQEAVSREVLEETLIQTNPAEFAFVNGISTPDNTRILMFCYSNKIRKLEDLNSFRQNNEVSEIFIGNRGTKLCFSLHQQVYDHWNEMYANLINRS